MARAGLFWCSASIFSFYRQFAGPTLLNAIKRICASPDFDNGDFREYRSRLVNRILTVCLFVTLILDVGTYLGDAVYANALIIGVLWFAVLLSPLARLNSSTFGQAKSSRQDRSIISHRCCRAQGARQLL